MFKKCCKVQGFYRKRWNIEAVTKEKRIIFGVRYFSGKGMAQGLSLLLFLWAGRRMEVVERSHLTAASLVLTQKIPNRLIKITFLGKVETAIKLDIKSVFDILGIRQLMQFWASGFLFNWSIYSIPLFLSHQPVAMTHYFFLSLWVCFPECHIIGTIEYLTLL